MFEKDIVFAHDHSNQKEKVYQSFKIKVNILLVVLIEFLCINKAFEDVI